MNYLIILPIVAAFLLGAGATYQKFDDTEKLNKYAVGATFLAGACAVVTIVCLWGEKADLFVFNDLLKISFEIDGLGSIFAVLVSFLWPLAVIYATEYMKHEGRQQKFFTFYIATFGVVLGIAFSANMLTLYLFYELLTFITLPLVMHSMDERVIYAGKKYLIYSVSGAGLVFIGMMIYLFFNRSLDFTAAGLGDIVKSDTLLAAYVLMFMGFGVKAAVFPFHGWLPGASVAPTTVTALLHAVAVVNAGVFAIMRATYNLFGSRFLSDSWAQAFVMSMAAVTICFGSWMAMRSKHFKRRLAYSTVSQLSYILFGVTLMSDAGFKGGLMHMIFHSFMKIVLFYTAGSVLYMAHKEYIRDVEGYGKKMPKTFMCFLICSLALIGVPPLAGFFSKYTIIQAASLVNATQVPVINLIAYLGVCALMISALFTAMYLLQIVILAYVPHKDFDMSKVDGVREAPAAMTVPMMIITAVMIAVSLFSRPFFNVICSLMEGGVM